MGKTSYLDYYKTILEKVSFDKNLLMKEYHKALQVLQEYEKKELNNWLNSQGFIQQPMTVVSANTSRSSGKQTQMLSWSNQIANGDWVKYVTSP
ncbi:hypothetical protein [Algoriphagus vanfongensis]|uniref:hypothetical protein n=1 Tax=Algoriphagus vanfongensis TaxID=426371 RepID=UPI000413F11E|nr:hypothetical protein [Algoriphagus vanfongensis]